MKTHYVSAARYSLTILSLLLIGGTHAVAATPDELMAQAELRGAGLIVHIGSGDGSLSRGLHQDGRYLVHGITTSPEDLKAARAAAEKAGVQSIVQYALVANYQRLPYARDLADVVILDRDALGAAAPGADEVLRIAAPLGVIISRKGGTWSSQTVPMPDGYGEWTHGDGDASGNPVSSDTIDRVPERLQWQVESLYQTKAANTSSVRAGNGFVVAVNIGRSSDQQRSMRDNDFKHRVGTEAWMSCRNAFNGALLWRRPVSKTLAHSAYPMVIGGDNVYVPFDTGRDTPNLLRALDLRTGELVHTFEDAGPMDRSIGQGQKFKKGRIGQFWGKTGGMPMTMAHTDGHLVVLNAASLLCYSTPDHQLLWRKDLADTYFGFLAIDEEHQHVVVTQGSARGIDPSKPSVGRMESAIVATVQALNLKTGQLVWENTDPALKPGEWSRKGGLIIAEQGVYLWPAPQEVMSLVAINRKTGATMWSQPEKVFTDKQRDPAGGPPSTRVATVRNGLLTISNQLRSTWEFDAATGEVTWLTGGVGDFNSVRCSDGLATVNFRIFGSTTWLTDDRRRFLSEAARGGSCGGRPSIAYGMQYNQPSGCFCFAMLAGFTALSSEPVTHEPFDPSSRSAERSGNRPLPGAIPASSLPESAPLFNDRDSDQERLDASFSVESAGMTVVTHRDLPYIEGRKGEQVVWRYQAGSRFTQAAAIDGDRVYAAGRDGWVYCLKLASGELIWRFQAAPEQRFVMTYGMLESAWPCSGVVVHQGQVYTAAGRHPDVDGGIYLYRLDADSGKLVDMVPVRIPRQFLYVEKRAEERAPKQERPSKNILSNQLFVYEDGNIFLDTLTGRQNDGSAPNVRRGLTWNLASNAITVNGQAYTPIPYQPFVP